VPAPLIRSTILALYKLVCMYVCMYKRNLEILFILIVPVTPSSCVNPLLPQRTTKAVKTGDGVFSKAVGHHYSMPGNRKSSVEIESVLEYRPMCLCVFIHRVPVDLAGLSVL